MEVNLDNIPSQIGTAIVEYSSGKLIKSTGDLNGDEATCQQLHNIFLDSVRCTGNESLRRISVCYSSHKFVMTFADKLVYIAKVVI